MITAECSRQPQARLNRVLGALGIARSVWYGKSVAEPKRPGRKPKGVAEALAERQGAGRALSLVGV